MDRAAGDQYREVFPEIVDIARASRQFLTRAVSYLAGEAQVRQFLDIGTGLPTADKTHEVAQRVAPDARVVYVDNDPLVLTHARALLTSTPQGVTAYTDADLRDPDTILKAAAQTLHFTRPIALMLMGILGHIGDHDEARSIVKRLLDPLPSGSYPASTTGPTSSAKRLRRPSNATTKVARSPTISVAASRSPASSTGWSWSSLAWCRFHGGDPILPLAVIFPPRSMPSVVWVANPDVGARCPAPAPRTTTQACGAELTTNRLCGPAGSSTTRQRPASGFKQ